MCTPFGNVSPNTKMIIEFNFSIILKIGLINLLFVLRVVDDDGGCLLVGWDNPTESRVFILHQTRIAAHTKSIKRKFYYKMSTFVLIIELISKYSFKCNCNKRNFLFITLA